MALLSGARLGPYEIVAPLGQGGMGEVYKARDMRLDRIVAIKILPQALAADPQFRDRFDREARAISQLTHPHICTLYDVGEQNGTSYLVMEYLDGETLATRLGKGALPLRQALTIAIEVAGALDWAHRAGITHRDLKPGNVMLTKSGAKLMDFGLAKTTPPPTGGVQAFRPAVPGGPEGPHYDYGESNLPTMARSLTAQGTILGTLHYMAPEQVEGKKTDTRTDIFAFGVVLYEMVTGKKAFEGQTQASVIASILTAEPQAISTLQPLSPPALDRVVQTCLAKDPDDRWQSTRDLLREVKWIADTGSQVGAAVSAGAHRRVPARTARLALGGAGLLVIGAVAAGLGVWKLKPSPETASPLARLLVGVTPADQLLGVHPNERNRSPRRPSRTAVALSPDGQRLVFSAIRGDTQQLYLRALDRLEATPIPDTENSENPFFSPDGQWVGFWQGGELKKMPVGGGPVVTICKTVPVFGASWGSNDTIVFGRVGGGGQGLWQVSANGGTPQALTTRDAKKGESSHRLPHILPDGKAVLFTIQRSGFRWDNAQIVVRSLVTGEQTMLVEGGADARYVPTGHLVYARLGTLMAVPFDLARLKLTGGAVGIVDGVMQAVNAPNGAIDTGAAQFSVSGSGALVYVPGGIFPDIERSLVWVDRSGAIQSLPVPPRPYLMPRLSPDGQRLALHTGGMERQLWVYDLRRGTLTRFTTDGQNAAPLWTPDGKRLAFHSTTTGPVNLFWKPADGSGAAERLTTSESAQWPGSWSPDGKTLAFSQSEPTTLWDIWTFSLADRDRTPRPFLRTAAPEGWPDFSPDGRWLAYASDESGRYEVYVQPYPAPGQRHQISTHGGLQPAWARNGRELFYTVPGSDVTTVTMMAVDVATTPTFAAGIPRPLESVVLQTTPQRGYDVAPDGRRFITTRDNERPPEPPPAQMILVQNWLDELKRRVPYK